MVESIINYGELHMRISLSLVKDYTKIDLKNYVWETIYPIELIFRIAELVNNKQFFIIDIPRFIYRINKY